MLHYSCRIKTFKNLAKTGDVTRKSLPQIELHVLALILALFCPLEQEGQDLSDLMPRQWVVSNVTAYLLVTRCRSFISERSNQTCGQALTIAL